MDTVFKKPFISIFCTKGVNEPTVKTAISQAGSELRQHLQ